MKLPYTALAAIPIVEFTTIQPMITVRYALWICTEKIWKETGGQYFRAQENSELDAVYQDIDKLERTKFSVKQFSRRNELFEPFALAALIVFLLEIILRTIVLKRMP